MRQVKRSPEFLAEIIDMPTQRARRRSKYGPWDDQLEWQWTSENHHPDRNLLIGLCCAEKLVRASMSILWNLFVYRNT